MSQFLSHIKTSMKSVKPKTLVLLIPLLLLPFIIGGLYYATVIRSKAQTSVEITDATADRISNVAAKVTFNTSVSVATSMQCAVSRTGVRFFAGDDLEASTQHIFDTQISNVTLNPNTSYYCYIYVNGQDTGTEIFIPASPLSRTFGIDASIYTNEVYGACTGDPSFDPELDINQDGCILLNDLNEFPEY